MTRSPLVVIPGRFSASASALRHGALVTARKLSEAVLRAGGEPLTVHPWAPDGSVSADEIARRLSFADAVLLPGGGDLAPETYGQPEAHGEVYDVDRDQDAFDIAVARWAIGSGVPLLAICRGLQVVNVALGGDLEQHMVSPHRHVTHRVSVSPGTRLAEVVGIDVEVSCYHHQRVSRVGEGLVGVAVADDGGVEALDLPGATGWFLAVQWHPEDTAHEDPAQQSMFDALIEAARS